MLSLKRILLILFICLIPFIFFYLKPDMLGNDAYAFVNHICLGSPVQLEPGAEFLFNLLPCNFFIFKTIMAIVFFVSMLGIAFIGDLFDKKNGWLVALFVLTAPVWLSAFFQFENDFLSYPFLIWGLYFTFKGIAIKKLKWKLLGTLLICGGGLFWAGSVFYLIVAGLLWEYPLLLGVGVLLVDNNLSRFVGTIMPNFNVMENLPLMGFLMCGIMLVGFFNTPKKYWLGLAFMGVIALINSKFAFLLIPLLIPGFVRIVLARIELKGLLKIMMVGVVLAFFIGASSTILLSQPNQDFWDALNYSQQASIDYNKTFKNEWSFGYWVMSKGIDTNYFQYGVGIDCNASICLTQFEQPDCVLIKRFKQFGVYDCP